MLDFIRPEFFPKRNEIPENARLLDTVEGRLLIDGQLISTGFDRRTVMSPILTRSENGTLEDTPLGTTPQASLEHMQSAVQAAARAWRNGTGAWPSTLMEERIKAISQFSQRMLKHRETIVRLLMWEICKTRADAEAEFDRTIIYIHDTLEAAKALDRDSARLQFAQGYIAMVRRMPLGVTLCMGPFNYPLNETFTTLIPALVMGNTTVVKVPRYGQLLWDCLLPEFQTCFPPGVVNIVNGLGREIVGAAMQSGQIDVLAFIGSSRVANTLKSQHPRPNRLRSILGLDAKNPAIILPDAHFETSLEETIKGALSFNGQRCTALKLVCVHESIADSWTTELAQRVAKLPVGLPWNPGIKITPLPDPAKPQELRNIVAESTADGARLYDAARALQGHATFIHPAVVGDVQWHHSIAQVEQFGPVIPVLRYKNIEDVIDQIVTSPFGMQASLFGRDPRTLGPLIDALSNQVARININTACQRGPDIFPFTGRKNSAEGTLSVHDALRAFSLRTMVAGVGTQSESKEAIRGILEHDTSNFLTNHVIL